MKSAEVRLHDHSKLVLQWIRPGLLSVEVWKPGSLKDGHGWLLQGSTLLDGESLQVIGALFSGDARDRAGGYEVTGEQ
jgi:hypothetical protein